MPVWIEIIVVLQLAAIIGLIVIVIFRRDSCGDSVLKTVPQTIELVYSLSGRTDLKIDQPDNKIRSIRSDICTIYV